MTDELDPIPYLGRDPAACVMELLGLEPEPLPTSISDTAWLHRYAAHCQLLLDPALQPEQALRQCFGSSWKLLCRSGRDPFLPILRNRQLSFQDLVLYAKALVDSGWQEPPDPRLLGQLIQQSYEYFDSGPAVPVAHKDMLLMRLAGRQGRVVQRDFLLVTRWLFSGASRVTGKEQWSGLLRRAKAWSGRLRAQEETATAQPWHFFCREVPWRGYEISPLADGLALWEEGQEMSNCVYDIRRTCHHPSPSRFFSVRKQGHRVATLELVHELADDHLKGTDRIYGRWGLQDCRLSRNRFVDTELMKSMKVFAWQYNLWSQRPSRQTSRVQQQEDAKPVQVH